MIELSTWPHLLANPIPMLKHYTRRGSVNRVWVGWYLKCSSKGDSTAQGSKCQRASTLHGALDMWVYRLVSPILPQKGLQTGTMSSISSSCSPWHPSIDLLSQGPSRYALLSKLSGGVMSLVHHLSPLKPNDCQILQYTMQKCIALHVIRRKSRRASSGDWLPYSCSQDLWQNTPPSKVPSLQEVELQKIKSSTNSSNNRDFTCCPFRFWFQTHDSYHKYNRS